MAEEEKTVEPLKPLEAFKKIVGEKGDLNKSDGAWKTFSEALKKQHGDYAWYNGNGLVGIHGARKSLENAYLNYKRAVQSVNSEQYEKYKKELEKAIAKCELALEYADSSINWTLDGLLGYMKQRPFLLVATILVGLASGFGGLGFVGFAAAGIFLVAALLIPRIPQFLQFLYTSLTNKADPQESKFRKFLLSFVLLIVFSAIASSLFDNGIISVFTNFSINAAGAAYFGFAQGMSAIMGAIPVVGPTVLGMFQGLAVILAALGPFAIIALGLIGFAAYQIYTTFKSDWGENEIAKKTGAALSILAIGFGFASIPGGTSVAFELAKNFAFSGVVGVPLAGPIAALVFLVAVGLVCWLKNHEEAEVKEKELYQAMKDALSQENQDKVTGLEQQIEVLKRPPGGVIYDQETLKRIKRDIKQIFDDKLSNTNPGAIEADDAGQGNGNGAQGGVSHAGMAERLGPPSEESGPFLDLFEYDGQVDADDQVDMNPFADVDPQTVAVDEGPDVGAGPPNHGPAHSSGPAGS